jgi:hypothetical protein
MIFTLWDLNEKEVLEVALNCDAAKEELGFSCFK